MNLKSVGWVLISLSWTVSPWMDKPLKSVTHGQCDASRRASPPFDRYEIVLLGERGTRV